MLATWHQAIPTAKKIIIHLVEEQNKGDCSKECQTQEERAKEKRALKNTAWRKDAIFLIQNKHSQLNGKQKALATAAEVLAW